MAETNFEITVDVDPEEVLREFVVVLSANPQITVTQPVQGVLVLDEAYTSIAQVVGAILLFPVGLLLLLLKRKRTATVTVDRTERGTDITVTGSVSRRVSDGLHGITEMLANDGGDLEAETGS